VLPGRKRNPLPASAGLSGWFRIPGFSGSREPESAAAQSFFRGIIR